MFQPDLLRGQRILVTGGATGLGRAMTEKFLSLGADAVICGRRGDLAKSVAHEMEDKYQRKVAALRAQQRADRAGTCRRSTAWGRPVADIRQQAANPHVGDVG